MKKIKFYKKENKWYAYLPAYIEQGGTEEECEMVAGADDWLDRLSNYGDDVTLLLSDSDPLSERIVLYESDEFGATYIAHTYKEEDINQVLWLCPVTVFVFGKYPDIIYYSLTRSNP
jgi:hypothetical protein